MTVARVTLGGVRAARRPLGGDTLFKGLVLGIAFAVAALLFAIAIFLLGQSWPAIQHYGFFSFLHVRWAPSEASAVRSTPNPYGIVQFIYGTVLSSALALVVAIPIAIGVALFITQVAPERVRRPLVILTELLAAVPSVVYGFWALFALLPVLRPVAGVLEGSLGKLPLIGGVFAGPFFGFSYIAASIVLTIMVLPIITAIVREVFSTVPKDHREAAFALGATRWEMIKIAVLPYSRSGILGASFLGLGRAFGETIAVTMVIGNSVLSISHSILGQGSTLASIIANEFTEASQPFQLQSLFIAGFWLLVIALAVNILARVIINRGGRVVGESL